MNILRFAALVLVALSACDRAPQRVKVSEAAPVRGSADRAVAIERDSGWLGVILPRRSLDLAPGISGQVERVCVREGDPVRRGQMVAILGTGHDQQDLTMAEVGLRAAETEVTRSRLELTDAENRLSSRLSAPAVFPKEEIRRAEIQKQVAAVNLETAAARADEQRARVAQARNRLDQACVRAPADGTVTRRYVEPGALAGPGQPVVRLISDGSLIVRFAAPPDQARSMRAASRVKVTADDGSAPAVIESVASEIDPPSGMVILVAALDPATRIKPGSVVQVRPE